MDSSLLSRLHALRFRDLRLLQLILREGSVRKAAAQLHVTQPAASAMLREVESALGMPLFVRTRRGMVPTKEVNTLLQRIGVLEKELFALHEDAHALRTRARQVHRLGVIPRSMPALMSRVLSRLTTHHPDLEFRLTQATSDVLVEGILRNEFDSIVARPTREMARESAVNDYEFLPLYEEGMCIVAHEAHPLVDQSNLSLTDTLPWQWVLPAPGSATRNLLIDQFLLAGVKPPVPVIESSGFLANLGLIEEGELLTVTPASAVHKYGPMHSIRALDLKLTVPLPQIALIWRVQQPLDGPLALLRQELLATSAQLANTQAFEGPSIDSAG